MVKYLIIPALLVLFAIGGVLKALVAPFVRQRDPRIAALAAANRKRKGP